MAGRHPASKASKSVSGFDPTTISGCVLWLDGADSSTLLDAAGVSVGLDENVVRWLNKSVSGGSFEGDVSFPRRSLQGDSIFFYSQSKLYSSPGMSLPSGTANATYFIVTKASVETDIAGGTIIQIGSSNFGDSTHRTLYEYSSTSVVSTIGSVITGGTTYAGTNARSFNQSGVPLVTVPHITTLCVDNLVSSLWVSGTPANNTNIDLQDTPTAVNTIIAQSVIGGPAVTNVRVTDIGNLQVTYRGFIYEILIYDSALSNTDRQIVEGYLALKWGLQEQLPADHPYKNIVRPLTRVFLPINIDGCQLWLDPSDVGTLTLNGTDKVISIRDKSGLGNDVANNLSSIEVSTLNEVPALKFPTAGSNNRIATPIITRNPIKRTYFFVIKYGASSVNAEKILIRYGNRDYFRQNGSIGKSKTLDMIGDPSSFLVDIQGYTGNINATQTYDSSFNNMTASAFFSNQTFVLCCVRDGEYYTFSTNGVSVGFNGNPIGDFPSSFAYEISSAEDSLVGDVIIYNAALTKSDLIKVEGYLMWKWGVRREASLRIQIPSNHPFYNFPPDSITPRHPELLLYKKEFDPSDLSPVIWIDPRDVSKSTVHSSGRVALIRNKGTSDIPFTPPPDIDGPLLTQSGVKNGIGLPFLDFSNGGNFLVTGAEVLSNGITLVLTTSTPHQIPVGAFVTLTVSSGKYADGVDATINSGPFQIVSGTTEFLPGGGGKASGTLVTFKTASDNVFPYFGNVSVTNTESYFFNGTSATAISGQFTYIQPFGSTDSLQISLIATTVPFGVMDIRNVFARNNLGTTGYYNTITGTSGSTIYLTSYSTRAAGLLRNLSASINYGQIPFTSVNYTGTSATISTPINHGIPNGATVGVCSNNSSYMPFQTSINSSPPANAAYCLSKTASYTTDNTVITVVSNPLFTGTSGSRIYTDIPVRVSLFAGTVINGRTVTPTTRTVNAPETYFRTTLAGSNATTVVVARIDQASASSTMTINGFPLTVDTITVDTPYNSNYINTTATVSAPTTTSITYPINRRLGTESSGRLLNITPFSLADAADIDHGYIMYPVKGYALENLALGTALNTNRMTIIWVSCLRQGYSRNNFSAPNTQSSVISAATTTRAAGGGATGGRDFRIQTSSRRINTSRISIIRNGTGGDSSPALVPGGRVLTSNDSHFRINNVIMNFTSSAVDDVPANTQSISTNGWGYAPRFQNLAIRSSEAGQPNVTLVPSHLRIGANTNVIPTTIATVAGIGGTSGFTSGVTGATASRLNDLTDVVVDSSGNMYIADRANHRVRMVPAVDGTYFGQSMIANLMYTIAGNGTAGFLGDGGIATSARLNFPSRVAVDSAGNLYIADRDNQRIRRVNSVNGGITTIAGNGTVGFSGDGSAATDAQLNTPVGLAVDSGGNTLIADFGNHRIRRLNSVNGTISTVAGVTGAGYNGDGIAANTARLNGPVGVAVDHLGHIYISDRENNRIRRINPAGTIFTAAGGGVVGFAGDGQLATSSSVRLNGPRAVAVDAQRNIYIADLQNNRIRMVSANTGRFFGQDMTANFIYTIAGSGSSTFNGDGGTATSAAIRFPNGVNTDSSGNVYIADTGNHCVREVYSLDYGTYQLTSHWYEGGLGDIMVFNSVLTFEQRKLVEGYLAEKYRCREFLGTTTTGAIGEFLHPYRTTPTSISPTVDLTSRYSQGLVVWFDAANYDTFTFVGGSGNQIESWRSAGGNLPLTITSTNPRRPILEDRVLFDMPGVRFNLTEASPGVFAGSPIGNTSATSTNLITSFSTLSENNEYTIIVVYKQSGPYFENRMVSNIISTSSGNSRLSTLTSGFTYYVSASSLQTKTYNPTPDAEQAYIAVNYRRGNTMYARRNGVQDEGATTSGTELNITANNFGLTLGAFSLALQATNPFAGEIFEHIIFRYALSDQEILQIEGYLAGKWMISNVLPIVNPYRSIRT